MRVSVHPADSSACGKYRVEWPAKVLIEAGHDVHIDKSITGEFIDHPNGTTEVLDVTVPSDADVVVLQRPTRSDTTRLIPKLKEKGVAIVVEIDDDFSHIHPNNIAYKRHHPRYSPRQNFQILNEAVRLADLVTVSTPRLAQIYGPKSVVLPNCVPEWYLSVRRTQIHGVGWSGSVDTHPDDLEITRGGLSSFDFRVIGTGKGVRERLGLKKDPEATGWLSMDKEYQEAVATLQVGVVPLSDNVFNHSKSWLKGLEYAALGVPFVASPVDEYKRISKLGAGLLASRNRQWTQNVKLLLDGPKRAEMIESGLAVAREYTYEKQAWRWLEAWDEARVRAALRIAS